MTNAAPGEAVFRRPRVRPTPFGTASVVVALFLAALSLYPLSKVLGRLFIHDGGIHLSAFQKALETPRLGRVLFNTAVVVIASGTLAVIIGSFLAWINERTDARMGLLTDGVPVLPFILPPVAGAVGWVMLFSPKTGLFNAFLRWILSGVGIHKDSGPFNIFTMYGLIFAYTV